MISLRLGKLKVMDYFKMGTTAITELSTDGTMAGNADTALPTEKAVKTYVGARETAAKSYADGLNTAMTAYVDSKQFEIDSSDITEYAAEVTATAETDELALADASTYLSDGDPVTFSTTDALPAGLVAGTVYYVRDVDTDSFKVSETSGGVAVNITDAGTGTHTVSHNVLIVDWTASTVCEVEISAQVNELVFVEPTVPCDIKLIVSQDDAGSKTVKYWPTNIRWAGGSAPTLTTTANKSDVIFMMFDGTNYLANIVKNY